MIRCILVDDEPLIRIGIRNKVNFIVNGFEIVGEANDALDALDLVTSLKPDVIFTDIRMPVMDGIALIKKCRETHPELIGVLLSGYRDFEYAKQGIQINAIDYLSKPIDPEELQKTLDKIKEAIKAKQFELMKKWQEEMNSWFLTGSGKYGLVDLQGEYSMHIFYNQNLNTQKQWINLYQYEVDLASLYTLKEWPVKLIVPLWCLDERREHKLIIVTLWEEEVSPMTLEQWALLLEYSLGNCACLWSATTPVRQTFQLLKSDYEHMNKALKMNRVLELPMRIMAPFSTLTLDKQVTEWHMKQLTMQSWLEKILHSSHADEMVKRYLNEALNLQNQTPLYWFEQFLRHQILFIRKQLGKKQAEEASLEDLVTREISELTSKNDTFQYLKDHICNWTNEQEFKSGRYKKSIIQQAIQYLDENYTGTLTIRTLADKFGYHRGYLSRQFKEIFKMTFTDYIIQKRMEASINLLLQTKLSIKHIAEEVGYGDTGYYMRLFKKRYHLTPTEYRERYSERNNMRGKEP